MATTATKLENPQGKIINIAIIPAMSFQFDFETSAGLYAHEGNNLVISFEDGGKIVLNDFYAQSSENLPEFFVEDNVKVSSEQFLSQFNDESLLPAAGPVAETDSATSGMNSYADNAGSLITGVSRLSGLGNSQWSRSTSESETSEQASFASPASSVDLSQGSPNNQTPPTSPIVSPTNPSAPANPINPTDPSVPTVPEIELKADSDFPADVRFVMFRDPSDDPASAWSMYGVVKGATDIDASFSKYGTASFDGFGGVTYVLNPEFAGEHNPPLVDYIKYTGEDGKEHSVQVVITTNPNFDDAAKAPGNYNDIAGGILYEVQNGTQAAGNYNTSSSNKDSASLDGADSLTYNALNDGSINAGRGDDSIVVSGDVTNSKIDAGSGNNFVQIFNNTLDSQISSGEDNDFIGIYGNMESSFIDSGAGNDHVLLGQMAGSTVTTETGNDQVYVYGNTESSSIDTGEGDDNVFIVGSAFDTKIDAGAGNNIVEVFNNMLGSEIKAGEGNDNIGVYGNMESSFIDSGAGDDRVFAGQMTNSSIVTGEGSDQVSLYNGMDSSTIDLGEGNNKIDIASNVDNSTIKAGAGDDKVELFGSVYGGEINIGDGNNEVSVYGGMGSTLVSGSGNDTITIHGGMFGKIDSGSGDDNIVVNNGMIESVVNVGDGNNNVTINSFMINTKIVASQESDNKITVRDLMQSSLIETGAGTDTITVNSNISDSSINAGAGNDKVIIDNDMYGSKIIAGTGSNTVFVGGHMLQSSSIVANGDDAAGDLNTIIVQNGMFAADGANNSIESNAGTITLGNTMLAVGNSNNTINAGSSVVEITSEYKEGVYAYQNSSNIINTSNDININSELDGVTATYNSTDLFKAGGNININSGANGIYSADGSSVDLKAAGDINIQAGPIGIFSQYSANANLTAGGAVNISTNTPDSYSYGVVADHSGANYINAQEVNIKVDGQLGATGVQAASLGSNIITGETVKIEATTNVVDLHGVPVMYLNDAVGVNAQNASNEIVGTKQVDINVDGKGVLAYGMKADGSTGKAENTVTAETVNITSTAGTSATVGYSVTPTAYGMQATGNSQNTINATGNVNVHASSDSEYGYSNAYGMSTDGYNSQNVINADGNVSVSGIATAYSGSGLGMNALNGGTNTINKTGAGTVEIIGGGLGMNSDTKGKNIIEAGAADVSVKGVLGAIETYSGSNVINTTGNVNIEAKGVEQTVGLSSYSSGKNSVTGGAVSINADSSNGAGFGVTTANYGLNLVTATTGAVDIKAGYIGVNSYANGKNEISAATDVNISTNSDKYTVKSVAADNSTNIITAKGGDVNISATSKYDVADPFASKNLAYGIFANPNGTNIINAENGAVNIRVNTDAEGKLIAGANSEAYGVSSISNSNFSTSTNSISAKTDVNILVASENNQAYGVIATNSENTISSSNVNINVNSGSSNALGMFAQSGLGQATNTINANDVNINVTAASNVLAYGMRAIDSGTANIINANDVNINVQGSDNSVGMQSGYVYNNNVMGAGGTNIIQSAEGHALTVVITAKTGMLAQGGLNSIKGHSVDGTSDSVTINGDIKSTGLGSNTIETGAGADLVTINGSISGNSSIINTGAGDDIITLNGAVLGHGLLINGGDGYDTLVLHAANWSEFSTNYQNLFEHNILNGIESIQYSVAGAVSMPQWFTDYCALNNIIPEAHSEAVSQASMFMMASAELDLNDETQPEHSLHSTHGELQGVVDEDGNTSVVSAHDNDYSNLSGMLLPHSDSLNASDLSSLSFEHTINTTNDNITETTTNNGFHLVDGADSGIIIINAEGSDSFSGSSGNNVFSWYSDENANTNVETSNSGTIVDFSISGMLDGTFVDGQNGNDKIDLSSLFTEGLQYLNVKSDGAGNAVIEVAASADAPAAQEIVLQDVYSNHSVSSGQEDGFNQMILQHIITNNN